MTQTIKIKRSTGSAAPSTLAQGELAYTKGTSRLYVGDPAAANTPLDIVDLWIKDSDNTLTLGADMSAATFKITNLGTPTATGDAATKGYVDGVAGVSALGDLTDVTLTSITDGEILVYDTTSPTGWINQTLSEAGIEPADATILKDADIGVTVQAYDAGLAWLDGLDFTNESTFKTAVNLEPGVDVQAQDELLQDIADISGTASAADQVLVSTGVGTFALESGATLRTSLGLGTGDSPTFAGVTADNIQVGVTGTNEIDTSSGNLTIDSAGGTVTVDDNLIVSGDLTVQGTTTTVESTVVTVEDPIFTLGGTGSPTANDGKDRGIEFHYNTGSGDTLGFFGYDISAGKFTFIPDATNASEVFSGTAGTILANFEVSSSLTIDSVGITQIQTAAEVASPGFVDNDTSLLTAAAIDDRILSYNYTTNTGTVTSVATGTGLSGGAITTSGTIDLDFDNIAEKTGDLIGSDRLTGVSGTTHFSETISNIPLSIFNNDSGWTSNTGDITAITLQNASGESVADTSILFGSGTPGNTSTTSSGDATFVLRVGTIDGGTY